MAFAIDALQQTSHSYSPLSLSHQRATPTTTTTNTTNTQRAGAGIGAFELSTGVLIMTTYNFLADGDIC